MTAPQPEVKALDEAVVCELSGISKKLTSDIEDVRLVLREYKSQLIILHSANYSNHNIDVSTFTRILIEGIDQLININRKLSQSECDFLKTYAHILVEYLSNPVDKKSNDDLLHLFRNQDWIRPITIDEELELSATLFCESAVDSDYHEIELGDLIDSLNDTQLSGAHSHDNNMLDNILNSAGTSSSSNTNESLADLNPIQLNNVQRELIDLVSAELSDIIDNSHSIDKAFNDPQQEHLLHSLLANMADQAENIGNAAIVIGLEGLGHCSLLFSSNIQLLVKTENRLTPSQERMLKDWPVTLMSYLQDINNPSTTEGILSLLTEHTTSEALNNDMLDHLRYLLLNPVFNDEQQDPRQDKACEADVDLTLPDDVNQELLDGLLQDLPSQTEEFSSAIQNIFENWNIDSIDTAQRIAHTLKGAANVVGVKGIANLTHHLEDILQAQLKSNKPPVRQLTEVLIQAADCLEAMTEALLGIDSPPADAVDVLQAVLDWANKLDKEKADGNYPDATEPDSMIEDNDGAHTELLGKSPITELRSVTQKENLLRVPVFLADELIRLAGETLISTSQIHEHINTIEKKQEALELHNKSLQQLSFDLEHLVDVQGLSVGINKTNTNALFDPLELDEFHEVHTISRKLVESAADSIGLAQELDKDLSGLKELIANQTQLHKESEELVLRTRMVPVKTITPRLKRGVRQASRLTGKQVELVVFENDTYMDSEVLNDMIEPLMHILRNAVDHGIEDTETRKEKDKPLEGVITLTFQRIGNQISIEIVDDGQGLDTDNLYKKALNTGLIDPDEDLSIENIQRLILEPGFSTRNKVTQTSGRGIGLDVVSVKIRELKGSIDIQSEPGQGCHFTLQIPISSFSIHSLLVRARQYVYAISSRGIEKVLYPDAGELREIDNVMMYKLGNQNYNVVYLESLLNLPIDRRDNNRSSRPIILVKDETGSKTAVLVQGVIDSRDVVVKSMGNYIPKLAGIVGATVLGNGSVSTVIDIPELIHSIASQEQHGNNTIYSATTETNSRRLPWILVVDDSLSARRSLAQFIEDMGIEVRTARDGMEAISIIDASRPDLMLVDMEMPKMNGLELTSHVRSSPEIKDIPVIMITSRSTDKHKRIAMEKGVNHYMIKPFDEDLLAVHINNILNIA